MIHYPETDFFKIFRTTLFNVISIISSTGFNASNLETGGVFVICIYSLLTVIGACTGSTSGGIKIFRFNILAITVIQSLRQKIMPHTVLMPKFNNRPLTTDVVFSVVVFMVMFFLTSVVSILLLSMYGLDFLTSVSSVFSAIGNTGIGLGPVVGSSGGGYCSLPTFVKWVLSADMLLGRLEFMSIFILIMPMTWRRNSLKRTKSETAL